MSDFNIDGIRIHLGVLVRDNTLPTDGLLELDGTLFICNFDIRRDDIREGLLVGRVQKSVKMPSVRPLPQHGVSKSHSRLFMTRLYRISFNRDIDLQSLELPQHRR